MFAAKHEDRLSVPIDSLRCGSEWRCRS